MLVALQVFTTVLVSVAFALALAHALELPGKLRLGKEAYYAMQAVYYPGFTIGGGIGEVGGTISTAALLFFTPAETAAFWWTLVALLGLIAMQAVYWLFTHPVNRFWVEGESLDRFSSRFFASGVRKTDSGVDQSPDWTMLRDRWEYSHVARAFIALPSFVALVIAVAL